MAPCSRGGARAAEAMGSSAQPGDRHQPRGLVYPSPTPTTTGSRSSPATAAFVGKWGSFGHGPGQLVYPYGIATDAAGNVYVADTGNSRVQKVPVRAAPSSVSGVAPGRGPGRFFNPTSIATDPAGYVYVADAAEPYPPRGPAPLECRSSPPTARSSPSGASRPPPLRRGHGSSPASGNQNHEAVRRLPLQLQAGRGSLPVSDERCGGAGETARLARLFLAAALHPPSPGPSSLRARDLGPLDRRRGAPLLADRRRLTGAAQRPSPSSFAPSNSRTTIMITALFSDMNWPTAASGRAARPGLKK